MSCQVLPREGRVVLVSGGVDSTVLLYRVHDLSKSGVVSEGARLEVDLSRTYSCMLGRDEPCGRCSQCQGRRAALAEA